MKRMTVTPRADRFYVPFLSEHVLGSVRLGLFLSCLVIFCCWPGHAFLNFKFSKGTPFLYPVFFLFTLIFATHHLMAFAKGEYQQHPATNTEVKDIRYTRDILLVLVRHVFLVHAILSPLYLAVATTTGLSVKTLLASVLILVLASTAGSLFGLFSLILFGPFSLWGFILSRALFASFFTVTGLIAPVLNPVYLIYSFFMRYQYQAQATVKDIITHSLFVGSLVVVLATTGYILFRRKGRTTE